MGLSALSAFFVASVVDFFTKKRTKEALRHTEISTFKI